MPTTFDTGAVQAGMPGMSAGFAGRDEALGVASTRTGLAFWAPMIAASMAMFIVIVDSTMMNVAVPTIVKDLNTRVSAVQGVIAMYSLVMASLMLLGGKLGALRGVKRMFIVGVVIYGAGTVLAAISWNVASLAIGWSLLEGVGAALILPLAYALLVASYSPKEQAIGFGVLGGVAASAAAVGPILGGILTTYASWRWGFAGEVLIALALMPFARYVIEKKTSDDAMTLDWGGTALSVIGLFSLVLGLILAGRYGWWTARRPFVVNGTQLDLAGLSPTVYLVGFGMAVLVGFVHWQRRREARGLTPLLQTRVLSNGTFVTGISSYLLQAMVVTGLLFVIPVFLQSAVGFSAFQSGLALLPFSLVTFAVSLGTASWGQRFSPKVLIQVGIGLMLVGTLLLYRTMDLAVTIPKMILPLAVLGTGMGLLIAHLVNLVMSSVDPADSPEASGVNNTFNQLGTALGTAVVGSLLMAFFYANLVTGVAADSKIELTGAQRDRIVVAIEDAQEVLTDTERGRLLAQLTPDEARRLEELARQSIETAMNDTLLAVVVLLGGMGLLTTFLPSKGRDVPPVQRLPSL
jgi:MFS family permease